MSRKKVSSVSKKVSSNKTIQLDNTKTIQKEATTTIETIYNSFLLVFGYAPTKSKQANTNSIQRIIEKNKVTEKQLINAMRYAASIQGNSFAPSIDSFWDIEDKWPQIARHYKRKEVSQTINLDEIMEEERKNGIHS